MCFRQCRTRSGTVFVWRPPAAGAVAKRSVPVKILGVGDIKAKLEVTAHAFSKSAAEKIEKAGGKAIKIETAKK